jgi:predicted aldo/keto reductase-like oxidoreductase
MMDRAKSLLLSESAFYAAAVNSVVDQEKHYSSSSSSANNRREGLTRRYSSFDLSTPTHNENVINVAKAFLSTSCPELLTILESHPDQKSAQDRLIKIGRNINATLRYSYEAVERAERGDALHPGIWSTEEEEEIGNELDRKMKNDASFQLLVRECSNLAKLLTANDDDVSMKCPTVRYGRTEIQMPIVSLGCMRFQQSWNRGGKPIKSPSQIEKECQENLVNIIKHALHCGVNHIETAQGYGCSELQIGMALKQLFDEGVCKREDLIIQTKGGISASTKKSDYKSSILQQIERLGVGYLDLFSIHGLNTEDHYNWLFDHGEKGNLIDAVKELQKEGKIRHIGFSTHAPAHIIKKAIETDVFDYLNLHYHFVGSYTASGDGTAAQMEGNEENIRLAQKHDMGIFIISPFDKGGRLYAPSNLAREIMLPDLEPMEYGSLWLWNQGAHTIVCGAARPSDLDQPVLSAIRSTTDAAKEDLEVVSRRIQERKERIFGKDWTESWHVGLPNFTQSEQRGFQIGNIVWLCNTILVYGMLDFAKDRYGTLTGNAKNWDTNKTWKENVFANPGFNWMPGCAYDESYDYTSELKDVPEQNLPRVLEAMEFVHKWCAVEAATSNEEKKVADEGEEATTIPLEYQTAYDMRPWTAFPER